MWWWMTLSLTGPPCLPMCIDTWKCKCARLARMHSLAWLWASPICPDLTAEGVTPVLWEWRKPPGMVAHQNPKLGWSHLHLWASLELEALRGLRCSLSPLKPCPFSLGGLADQDCYQSTRMNETGRESSCHLFLAKASLEERVGALIRPCHVSVVLFASWLLLLGNAMAGFNMIKLRVFKINFRSCHCHHH